MKIDWSTQEKTPPTLPNFLLSQDLKNLVADISATYDYVIVDYRIL